MRTLFLIGTTAAILTLVAPRTAIRAADFSGRAVGVSDGDTISVMHDGRAEKVRLNGIDAPEKDSRSRTERSSLFRSWHSAKT